ncbi:MAG: peptidoglycan DD-metalloendopeptidase family protein [Nitriliruptoraceae bacterium]
MSNSSHTKRRRGGRRRGRGGALGGASAALVAVLLVAAAGAGLGPAGYAQDRSSGAVEQDLEQAEREGEAVAEDLGEVRAELSSAEEDLAAVGARLEDARARLTAAEGQVALAEAALADAEEASVAADEAATQAVERLEDTERALSAEEAVLGDQLVHTFKFGTSGAQAGAMALEMLRRAADPNAFAVGLKQLETVVDVQDRTVERVVELRSTRQRQADDAAHARAAALQAEDDAARTLTTVEELRAAAAELALEVEAEEAAQQRLVADLRRSEQDVTATLARVEARQGQLRDELARSRAAEEAARRAAEEAARRVAEEAARRAAEESAGTSGGADAEGSGSGRLGLPGAGGGPPIAGSVCPVQGAVAGRDFSNDWGYPRSGGRTHEGNDIFAARGTPIVAVADAVIVRWNPPSAPTGLGGITVTYRTADGSEWYNAHLDSVAEGIAPGVQVARGQPIGTVGNTGNARTTPPHVHLGRRYAGSWVNPWPTISPAC